MIHYALRCADGHEFDGWFRGSAAFDAQAAGGLLACPLGATTQVGRAMMAPRLSLGAAAPRQAVATPPPAVESATAAKPEEAKSLGGPIAMPDQMRAALQRIRAEVERKCDYVGPHFAETARAMHDGTEAPRPIYGETTPDQATALAEDGIAVSRIPWVPRADG